MTEDDRSCPTAQTAEPSLEDLLRCAKLEPLEALEKCLEAGRRSENQRKRTLNNTQYHSMPETMAVVRPVLPTRNLDPCNSLDLSCGINTVVLDRMAKV